MAKMHGNKVRLTVLLDPIEYERIVRKAEARQTNASAYTAQLLHQDGAYQYHSGYMWASQDEEFRARLRGANPEDRAEAIRISAIVEAGMIDAADFEAGIKRALQDLEKD